MQSKIRRRRIIKSGHFGSQFRFDDAREKKEGLMTVTRNITSGITPSSDNPCIGAKKVIYFNLSYVIYRPDLLHSSTATSTSGRGPSNIHKKPLLLLHGGPSIPSDYLQPIATHMHDRCIIFYDQIGCGNSSVPSNKDAYSIQNAVNDLDRLIQHLQLNSFHLYGHSFGGILAYEYFKWKSSNSSTNTTMYPPSSTSTSSSKPLILSLTLASAPFNVSKVDEEVSLLLKSLEPKGTNQHQHNHVNKTTECCNDSIGSGATLSESEDDNSSSSPSSSIPPFVDAATDADTYDTDDSEVTTAESMFQHQFVCRTSGDGGVLPEPLQEAYNKMGKVWVGTDVIQDYVAQPPLPIPASTSLSPSPQQQELALSIPPPLLLLRGNFDFVSEECSFNQWKRLMCKIKDNASVDCKTLEGCSHYAMVEDVVLYASTLDQFLMKCECKDERKEEKQ